MPVNVLCERCGDKITSISVKDFRKWSGDEVCDNCKAKEAALVKSFDTLKARYTRKMDLALEDFRKDLNKAIAKIARENQPSSQ